MSPEQVQVEICKYVCKYFIASRAAVDRKSLVVRFEHPELLREMVGSCLLRESNNAQMYFPRLGAFVVAEDTALLEQVKGGIVAALTVARQLFISSNNDNFTWEAFFAEVQRSSGALDEDTLRLGLLYLTDLSVLQSYQMNDEGTALTRFSVGEWIVKVRNAQEWLEHELARYCRKAQIVEALGPEEPVPEDDSVQVADGDVLEMTRDAGFDWDLLHPEIRKVAFTRFRAGHFADSVEAALKAVNERVRALYKGLRGAERDGAALMKEAFSPRHPALRLGDLDTATGRDMQLGYMEIFAGAMTGIRNPKAHGIIQIDAVRATHFLFLASLLMHKIDEAEPVQRA